MPRYNPDDVNQLLPSGDYDAVVKRAELKVSAQGNDMIELILTCYAAGGIRGDVYDYLVFTPGALYKIKQFSESAGLDFGRGELQAEECSGKNVRVSVGISKQAGYADKNKVADYLVQIGGQVKPADDDIPF